MCAYVYGMIFVHGVYACVYVYEHVCSIVSANTYSVSACVYGMCACVLWCVRVCCIVCARMLHGV